MVFWCLFISLIASTVGAISGIGGGILIKPFLDAISVFPLATINFLSGCTVLAMTAMSMLLIRRGSPQMNLRTSSFLGVGAALGGIAGKELFELAIETSASSRAVGITQSALLLLITVAVYFFVRFKAAIRTHHLESLWAVFFIGFVLGVISSFLGIGGGPLNIALLNYFFSMDGKTAAINSLYIIFIAQVFSLASIFITQAVPAFDPLLLGLMAAGGVAGAFIGRSLNHRMSSRHVDTFFRVLLAGIALLNVWNIVRYVI
jgi:uncharacterized membrane protein YfcA